MGSFQPFLEMFPVLISERNLQIMISTKIYRLHQTWQSLFAKGFVTKSKINSKSLDHIGFMDLETRAKVVKHNIGVNAPPLFSNEADTGPGGRNLFSIVDKRYAHETYGSYSGL